MDLASWLPIQSKSSSHTMNGPDAHLRLEDLRSNNQVRVTQKKTILRRQAQTRTAPESIFQEILSPVAMIVSRMGSQIIRFNHHAALRLVGSSNHQVRSRRLQQSSHLLPPRMSSLHLRYLHLLQKETRPPKGQGVGYALQHA